MPKEPPHRHNGGPLSDDMAQKLWGHVRALEILEEQMQDIRDDVKARKELSKADGFDGNIVAALLKRRKAGQGETATADMLIRIYEESLEDQGVIPLEQSRITPAQRRRDVEEIGQTLHGEPAPDMPEKAPSDEAAQAIRDLDASLRKDGATMTMRVEGMPDVTFGKGSGMFADDTDPF